MPQTVVLIEDDPDILDLIADVLTGEGCAVVVPAEPAAAALTAVGEDRMVFLIDLMLPGISGVELAGQIRSVFPRAPMIAMSASRLMLDLAAASGYFQDALPKPFNLTTLLDTVARCLPPEPITSPSRSVAS